MARSRSSSTDSSSSTTSSSSSSSSSVDRRNKSSYENRRRHQAVDDKSVGRDVRRHDNINRRRRSRSNDRQYNDNARGRRDNSNDQRLDRSRSTGGNKGRYRQSSADFRRDRKPSSSDDKRVIRKQSSYCDKRRTRKRSSSDEKQRDRKGSSSEDRHQQRIRKYSSSDDNQRKRNKRESTADNKGKNRKDSISVDRRKERIRSSSDERSQNRKNSDNVDKKRYRKESSSNDRRKTRSLRTSRSSDRSLTTQIRQRSISKDRKSLKRKSIDPKGTDQNILKKSKHEVQEKKEVKSNNNKSSKDLSDIIPNIPSKWDKVDDDASKETEESILENIIPILEKDQKLEVHKSLLEDVLAKKSKDDKADIDRERTKINNEKSSKIKIVLDKSGSVHSSCIEKGVKEAVSKSTNARSNKSSKSDQKEDLKDKGVTVKKQLIKDPVTSKKSVEKEHRKKSTSKGSKNKCNEAKQMDEIVKSGYESDSESDNKSEKSQKHRKRNKKKSQVHKSKDHEKIMSDSEDELQKRKAQLQRELEIEEELERQEKIKHERTEKRSKSKNLDNLQTKPSHLDETSEVNKKSELKDRKGKNMETLKVSSSRKSEKSKDSIKIRVDSDVKDEKPASSSDKHIEKKRGLKIGKIENLDETTVSSSGLVEKMKQPKLTEEKNLKDSKCSSNLEKGSQLDDSKSQKDCSTVANSDNEKKREISNNSKESKGVSDKKNEETRRDVIEKVAIEKRLSSKDHFVETKIDVDASKSSPASRPGEKKKENPKSHKQDNLNDSKVPSSKNEEKKIETGTPSKIKKEEKNEKFILTESPVVSSMEPKTSDTYWNKYADKLGIKIDDPKNLNDHNGNKQKLSPVDVSHQKKVTKEEIADNKDISIKADQETSIIAQSLNKESVTPVLKKAVSDSFTLKTGGAYIPPARLKMMQDQITDKSSLAYQRLAWEALKKSINGLVNKVNVSNIGIIVRELFKENIVRGRGLLCRALMQAQAFSPTFTHVYAAMVAVINTKFPQIGELLLHRLVLQLRRGVKRNDKNSCMASCRFIGHLINQQVAHEVVALEILTMLLEKAKDLTDESEVGDKSRKASVELAIAFLKDCGMKLSEVTPKGLMIVMETLRNILHEGKLDHRFQYMIEVLMAIKKDGFKEYPAVLEELDLVEEEDQFTHVIELDGKLDTQEMLNVFKLDPEYEVNESKYKELKAGILGEDSGEESGGEGSSESGADSDDEESEEEKGGDGNLIVDLSEANLVAFRRTVYLTIQSSLDVDECAHKLLKGEIKPGWEEELCNMIIDCCAQQRTYMKFYGLLAQRFCMLNKIYQQHFEKIFKDAYETCHRLEIEKLRNVAKIFSHLFFSDAISWESFSCIHLNQDETTSSSRVFLKILFEELGDFMGLCKLNERLRDPTLAASYEGLLPRDNPVNTRFAINFFTTIGLGGLTDDLREFLRSQPKPTAVVAPTAHTSKDESSDSSSSSGDSSSDGSSSSSDSSSSSSSEDSSSDTDSSSSESSSSESSSDSSFSDSSSSDNSSSEDSYKRSSLKNKKKLLKKLQMEQKKATKVKHSLIDKQKTRDEKHTKPGSSKDVKSRKVDGEDNGKKLDKSDRRKQEKIFERQTERSNAVDNRAKETSDEDCDNARDSREREPNRSARHRRDRSNEGKQGRHHVERPKDNDRASGKRNTRHSLEREERKHSREKSNDFDRNRDKRISKKESYNTDSSKRNLKEDERRTKVDEQRNIENEGQTKEDKRRNGVDERRTEEDKRKNMSDRSESSDEEAKTTKNSGGKEKEIENKRENDGKDETREKKKDLKSEKRKERDDSEKEDDGELPRKRRHKERESRDKESKSKSSKDKDRERKDRRARRLSQV